MQPQKPYNSLEPGPEIAKRRGVAKERVAQSARSWTVQNQMGGDLGWMSAGAARRILDSANSSEIGA